jgi:hypothetical protein
VFNKLYRSDDRFEVAFIISVDAHEDESPSRRYPGFLGDPKERGIAIYPFAPFQHHLTNESIEKCVFAPCCITSGLYLFLAAQSLAAGCSVLSHSLESTQTPASKVVVSFFADTQFDELILFQVLAHYRECHHRPAAVFFATIEALTVFQYFCAERGLSPRFSHTVFPKSSPRGDDGELFSRLVTQCGRHESRLWRRLHELDYPLIFVFDADAFKAQRSPGADTYDLLVHVAFNMLPCFFQSHLIIYACDDFTFSPKADIAQHPGSVLLRQADVVLVAQLRGAEFSPADRIQAFVGTEKTIAAFNLQYGVPTETVRQGDRRVLLLDDFYPAMRCNAAKSISKFLAKSFGMTPIKRNARPAGTKPIFSEPAERLWPALVLPDRPGRLAHLIESVVRLEQDKYDAIVSAAAPLDQEVKKTLKPVVQFTFGFVQAQQPNCVPGIGCPTRALKLPELAFDASAK